MTPQTMPHNASSVLDCRRPIIGNATVCSKTHSHPPADPVRASFLGNRDHIIAAQTGLRRDENATNSWNIGATKQAASLKSP